MSLVPDGFDPELTLSTKDSDVIKLRRSIGVPDENFVVLYSGTLSRAKGVHHLLDLVPQAVKANERITFIFIGYGDLLDEYRNALSLYVQTGNVIFTGQISYFDLPTYFSIAALAVDPKHSSTESSAKMTLYLSASLPVVCLESPNQDLEPYVTKLSSMDEILPLIRAGALPQEPRRTFNLPSYSWEVLAEKISTTYLKLLRKTT
jgi:glycosyltransferase involved in cell wall biosynthesis